VLGRNAQSFARKEEESGEAWNCFDFLTMYQQIGWVSDPPLP